LKRVFDDLDPWLRVFEQEHFHDVESEKDIRIIEHSQPGETAARDSLLFPAVNRRDWPAKIFARPRFHLDKDERVVIATDDVDLAAGASAKIAI
jgi:hypothetical protein